MALWIVTGAAGHLGNIFVRGLCDMGHDLRAVVGKPTKIWGDIEVCGADVRVLGQVVERIGDTVAWWRA